MGGLLLAGCVGASEDGAAAPEPGPDGADDVAVGPPSGASRPELPVGRSFTFEDASLYDVESEITVVVARKNAEGYLLAGATEADVLSGAIWGRPWFGEVTRELSSEGRRLFVFPITDGATWEVSDGLVVTARAADVRGEPGFVIEGQREGTRTSYTYAPSIGYFTDYLLESDGLPLLKLTLRSVGTSDTWVSWKVGPLVAHVAEFPPTGAPVATLEVDTGYDAIVASMGGFSAGRTVLASPGGTTWTEEFPGAEDWRTRAFPPESGTWALSAAAPADGFGYVRAAAVQWTRGEIEPAS